MLQSPFRASVIALGVAASAFATPRQTIPADYGTCFRPMTTEQQMTFEQKVKELDGKAGSLAEFVRPSIEGLRQRNPGKQISFELRCGQDVGEQEIYFFYGCYTPLKYGFTMRATVHLSEGDQERMQVIYVASTDKLVLSKVADHFYVRFKTRNMVSADLLILAQGKLLQAWAVVLKA